MEEDDQFLSEMCVMLRSVGSNLSNLVEDCSVDANIVHSGFDSPGAELVSKTRSLKDDLTSLLGPLAAATKEGADKYDKIQSRYNQLHRRWLEQRDQLAFAQDEIMRLRNQVMHQSTFCASLGAILGNLVWQASRFPHVIDVWLSKFQKKVGEFLCIVNGIFVSFINTYGSVLPSDASDESQFVTGLCGIVTNLSAVPEGRQFLVTHPNGKDFLEKLVKLMPLIPLPTGGSLARLMLMILYNVSINQAGLSYLIELRVCRSMDRYMDESASVELKQLSLRLLQSVTFELKDASTIDDIRTIITVKRIQQLSMSESEDFGPIAKEVLANLEKS